jgi:drug/metabolite transporter (DMT)-like permease
VARTASTTAALIAAIVAWSMAPLWIVNARGLASAPVEALLSLVTATVVAVVVSSFSRRYNVVRAWRSTRARHLLGSAAFVGGLAFFAYPLLFFSALQTGPPLLVNLVIYLWPILGLVMVAVVRREAGSLELLLAAGFGFAGAALAILNGTHGPALRTAMASSLPYALAALGAMAYGSMSAYMSVTVPPQEGSRGVHFFLIALCAGGLGCLVVLALIAAVQPQLLQLQLTGGRGLSLLIYAILHPLSHFCWLTAIQDRRLPGFASAFLVPVGATSVLALAAHTDVGPQIFAALTLVLSGILFSSIRDRGVPVAYAIILAATGSLQISFALPVLSAGADEVNHLTDVLVGLVGIVGGFILTNSIARYTNLQRACEAFYARVGALRAVPDADALADLEAMEQRVLHSARLHTDRRPPPRPANSHPALAREWAQVDLTLASRVSPYEWLVLTLGATGVIFALHMTAASPALTVNLVRAIATAVVVGLLFAVRDYDLNRPGRVVDNLRILRSSFNLPPPNDGVVARWFPPRSSTVDWLAVALVLLVFASTVSLALNLA